MILDAMLVVDDAKGADTSVVERVSTPRAVSPQNSTADIPVSSPRANLDRAFNEQAAIPVQGDSPLFASNAYSEPAVQTSLEPLTDVVKVHILVCYVCIPPSRTSSVAKKYNVNSVV